MGTWYTLVCSVAIPSFRRMEWRVKRRLSQLREHLHLHVKAELGDKVYERHFVDARFAHHGGFPGTTSRLHNWCGALAACIHGGHATPNVVAIALHFLDAPAGDAEGRCREIQDDDVCLCSRIPVQRVVQRSTWPPLLHQCKDREFLLLEWHRLREQCQGLHRAERDPSIFPLRCGSFRRSVDASVT